MKLLTAVLTLLLFGGMSAQATSVPATPCLFGDNEYSFNEGLAAFRLAGTDFVGFIDKSGKVVIQPKFLVFNPPTFYDGMAAAFNLTTKQWGAIDKEGNLAIPYFAPNAFIFSEGFAAVQTSGGYGYINKKGVFVIPSQFEDARPFREGLAAVKSNGKWGFIDSSGKMIINPEYDSVSWGAFFEGLAGVMKDNHGGFIDESGTVVIPLTFRGVSVFSEGLAAVSNDQGLVGYIDKTGKNAIPFRYKPGNGSSFCNGLARVYVASDTVAVIDKKGNEQFRVHDGLMDFASDGIALLRGDTAMNDGWMVLVNSSGQRLLKVHGISGKYSEGVLSVGYRRNNMSGLSHYSSDGSLLSPESVLADH